MTITVSNNAPHPPEHDFDQTRRFLHALDPDAIKFTFLLLGDGESQLAITRDLPTDQVCSEIPAHNSATGGLGCFVTINETALNGSRNAGDIRRVRAVYIDADSNLEQVLSAIESFALEPSAVIESSPGKVHAYWFVAGDFPLAKFKPVQQALINHFGTDPSVNDLPRVMRLPGSLHMKTGVPHLVHIKTLDGSKRYTYNQIVASLAEVGGQRGALVSLNAAGGTQTAAAENAYQRASNVIDGNFPARPPIPGDSELSAGIKYTHRNVLDFDKARSAGRWLAEQGKLDGRAGWRDYWLFPLTHEAGLHPDLEPKIKELFDEVCEYSAQVAATRGVKDTETWAGGNASQWDSTMQRPQHNGGRTIASTYQEAIACGWTKPAPQLIAQSNPGGDGALMAAANVTPFPVALSARPALRNGVMIKPGHYDAHAGKQLFEEKYVLLDHGSEVAYHCYNNEGIFVAVQEDSIERLLSNVYVWVDTGTRDASGGKNLKSVKLFNYMKSAVGGQRALTPVFKPDGAIADGEFNMWRGWGVERQVGTDKVKPLVEHIRLIICRGDPDKFGYLMNWMAWAVQHPDKQAGVAVILQSTTEGTGKTTLSKVLQIIFGEHGAVVDTPEGLLTKFNAHQEHMVFAACEEASFAGDHRIAEHFKTRLTCDYFTVEGKFRTARQVQNRLHLMMTTNSEWPVQAGDGARRFFICEVSNEKAGDEDYFDGIYSGLEAGGYGQFLNLLLEMDLGDFTPAKGLVKTKELAETQRRTAGTIFDWLMTSTERGELAAGPTQSPLGLGKAHSLDAVYERYALWTKTYSGRKVDSPTAFKDKLGKILGKSAKRRASVNGRREWHSAFPDADKLRSATLGTFNIHEPE